jgi:uncharacterized phage protein gp47/JayE
MTVTELPMPIPTTTRDGEIAKWKRSFNVRVPDADVGAGTQPDTDARVCADILMPLYAAATINNNNTVLELARGVALEQWAEREGVDARREAVGASGSVTFAGSTGGATIVADDEIKDDATGLRYRVIATDLYVPGDAVAIVGKDTGPDTNLPAGTQLKWTSPRPGSSDFALISEQSDGAGLTGGRDKENDDELLIRIQQEKQNRAASGNDAEYQLEAEKTPDVAMQKAFTYPAIIMAGTTCVVFSMRPQRSGGSRVPNAAQVSIVELHVNGEFPGDDGALYGLIADQNTDVVYELDWSESATSWTDLAPWPARYYDAAPLSGPGTIRVSAAASATVFTVATANAVYTGIQQPTVGQTIAFYDQANFVWRRKRILSFTGSGPWVITCDTTNNASDVSYTPIVGQPLSPWSDSLPSLLPGVWAYFDTLGPGEQVSVFYDEGTRQRRQPPATESWNHTTTNRGLVDALDILQVADVGVLFGDEVAPAVGTPGVLSYMLLLRWIVVTPKT